MEVLLLSGYRPHPIGLDALEDGEIRLDSQIRSLKEIGLTPIVVLSGNHADDVLRVSQQLESCELVFDANDNSSNLFTNLRSGLHVTKNACFALPVEIPVPPEGHWKHLKAELIREGLLTAHHVIHAFPTEGAAWQHWRGFPLLVTAIGNRVILDLKTGKGLTDERIRYYRLPSVSSLQHPLRINTV